MPAAPATLARAVSACCCSAIGSRPARSRSRDGGGAHGGGDAHLLEDVFRPRRAPDPLGRRAGYRDGLRSVAVGIAANQALETGLPVRISTFDLPLEETVR